MAKSRSGLDNQEQEYFDGTGKIGHNETEKHRYQGCVVIAILRSTCDGWRGDDERICKWVTTGIVSHIKRDKHDSSQKRP